MNPAVEQAVAEALPHANPYAPAGTVGHCSAGHCWCGADKRRNVLLAKLATQEGNLYGHRR